MKERIDKVIELATDGLLIDGGHHKQWYLEKILETMGVNLKDHQKVLNDEGYEWEEGIAP